MLKDLETEIEEKKQHDEKLKKDLNASLKQTLHALSVAKHKEFEEVKAQSKFHEAEIEKFRQERIKVTSHRFDFVFWDLINLNKGHVNCNGIDLLSNCVWCLGVVCVGRAVGRGGGRRGPQMEGRRAHAKRSRGESPLGGHAASAHRQGQGGR